MSFEKELKPLPMHTVGGKLNTHFFWTDEQNRMFLRRKSLENSQWEDILRTNKKEWGFNTADADMKVRNEEEMYAFVDGAVRAGLRVLPVTPDNDGGSLSPFLKGAVTLDQYLPSASEEDARQALTEIFEDIEKAHSLNIVYGDRWPNNILVDPELGIVNIDFDIRLEGPGKELDLAQLIFYSIALNERLALPILKEILKPIINSYSYDLVKRFATTKVREKQQKYGHLQRPIQELFEYLDAEVISAKHPKDAF